LILLYLFFLKQVSGSNFIKVFPSGKCYTAFVILSGLHKGVYINFKDFCLAKEGIQSSIYKGFYSREEAEKTLELNIIGINKIKRALEPENPIIVINAGQTKTSQKTYKDSANPNISGPINDLNLDNFKKIQSLLFKVHNNQPQNSGLYIGVHAYFNQKFVCINKTPYCRDKTNCPCKSFGYEDLAISARSLLDYGCLESILIPLSDRFERFSPSINEAINLIQAKMMDYIAIKITT